MLAGVTLQTRALANARVNMDVIEPALLAEVLHTHPAILHPGTTMVSLEKFRNAQPELNNALHFAKERHAAAKISIIDWQGIAPLAELKLNPQQYDELAVLPPRAVTKTTRQWPVIIIEQGKRRNGLVRVDVVQPK